MIRPSELPRLAICPTSAALPRIDRVTARSERGSVVHAFLADYLKNGDSAYERVPDAYKADCFAIDTSKLPVGVGSVGTEVHLSRNGMGGTTDVLGLTDVAVVLGDWKTGWTSQPPAREHKQLLWYAIAAAEAYGKREAIVFIGGIRDDGRVWIDIATLDCFDLDAAAAEIDEIIRRANQANAGDKVTTGEHCKYCPAFANCPATKAVVGLLAVDPRMIDEEVRIDLTPANAARAWDRIKLAERVIDDAKAALKTFAETVGPFDLANGNVVGPVETSRRSIDATIAQSVLEAAHGPEFARAAIRFEPSTSFTAIKEALAPIAPKGKLAGMQRAIETALDVAGAVKVSTGISVKEHKPKALPCAE